MIELMLVVALIGIMATISIALFTTPRSIVEGQNVLVRVDEGSSKLLSWASQNNNNFKGLNAGIAKQVSPQIKWTNTSPPGEGELKAEVCGASASGQVELCGQVTGCVEYFKSDKKLCASLQMWPRGAIGDPQLRTRRTVYCEPACSNPIYSTADNGTVTGSLGAVNTKVDNGPWPRVPDPSGN